MVKVKADVLRNRTESLLLDRGCDHYSAAAVADGLVETSLRGVDSHGIRLLPHYIRALEGGRINGRPVFKIDTLFPTLLFLDADGGFGHAAGFKAIDSGIQVAAEYGSAVISVKNSSHPGAMASFALRASRNGFCAFAFTNADALIQSFNSTERYFGTNPICFAAPRSGETDDYCIDMAPTYIPWNKLLECKEKQHRLPGKFAVDINGDPTDDPENSVGLMPIGGYKGFALASMVEVLCGVYSGMPYGSNIKGMYKAGLDEQRHLSQMYIIFKTTGIANSENEEFEDRLSKMCDEVRGQKSIDGSKNVMVPNDPQIASEQHRLLEGIELSSEVSSILGF